MWEAQVRTHTGHAEDQTTNRSSSTCSIAQSGYNTLRRLSLIQAEKFPTCNVRHKRTIKYYSVTNRAA